MASVYLFFYSADLIRNNKKKTGQNVQIQHTSLCRSQSDIHTTEVEVYERGSIHAQWHFERLAEFGCKGIISKLRLGKYIVSAL